MLPSLPPFCLSFAVGIPIRVCEIVCKVVGVEFGVVWVDFGVVMFVFKIKKVGFFGMITVDLKVVGWFLR